MERLVGADGNLLPHVAAKGEQALRSGFVDGGYGTGGSPFTGDVYQIGGIFVLERDRCLFAHRAAYPGVRRETAPAAAARLPLWPPRERHTTLITATRLPL